MDALMFSRRAALQAAGLYVGFAMVRPGLADTTVGVGKTVDPQTVDLKTVDPKAVDAFLVVEPSGRVTLYTGKVDLGTGARAAYRQIVAEELMIGVGDIDQVEGDTGLTPDQGRTAASAGISIGGMRLRRVAATARLALLGLAAKSLGQPVDALETAGGMVRPKTGGAGVSYGALVGGGRFDLAVDMNAPIVDPATYRIVGQSVPRPDLPAKLTGAHTYIHDFKVPGMLHGRVVRPPMSDAALASLDETSVADIPGLVAVVRNGDFLGVVATSEWSAIRAARQLKATWTPRTTLPGSEAIFAATRATPVSRDEIIAHSGDAEAALAAAAKPISATYLWPAQSHGSIGPSCAVADVTTDAATIWTASQSTHAFKPVFARFLGLDPARVRLIYLDGSGCYGMNGHEDAAADAALLSRAVGKPVRVQWMREDEHGLDPKGPPQVLDLRGAVDAAGRIVAWETRAWLLDNTKGLFTVTLLAPAAAGLDQVTGTFAGLQSGNTDPPYAIPDMVTKVHWRKSTPLRAANLRGPGKLGNAFAVESFTDELAALTGADPLAYRLDALREPRAHDVLRSVAKRMAWTARPAAFKTHTPGEGPARGRGIAYVHYKQAENFVAIGAEVEVARDSGVITVLKITCAHDCGMMVNPDAVHAQVEGSILQTVSRVLFEEVMFDTKQVTSLDWARYPILTFPDVPVLDIELIDRRFEKPVGAGEAAAAPVAAAIGNAVHDATGARLRQVPFTPARVKSALASRPT